MFKYNSSLEEKNIMFSLNNLKWKIIFLISISLVLFNGCGRQGTDSSNNTGTKIISGKAIDGYIKEATICLDINKNGICDNSEPSAVTKEDGSFSFKTTLSGTYSIIMLGGVDVVTGENFTGVLKNVINISNDVTTNITPVTTLITEIYDDNISLAKQIIATNLDINISKIEQDPTKNKNLFSISQQIVQFTNILISAMKVNESNSTKTKEAFTHIMKQLALSINDNNTTKDIDFTKVITKIETTTFNNQDINISNTIKEFIKDYMKEIKNKADDITNISELDNLQESYYTFTTDAKEKIKDDQSSHLSLIANTINY